MGEQSFTWTRVSTIDEMEAFYLSRLPAIREAARLCGYAIGLHGSQRRDFDLIAMPWRENAYGKEALAKAIHNAACGMHNEKYQWEQKPAGRWATSFPICWTEFHYKSGEPRMIGGGHIDLSIMEPRNE